MKLVIDETQDYQSRGSGAGVNFQRVPKSAKNQKSKHFFANQKILEENEED
jgi:hypothetical protein